MGTIVDARIPAAQFALGETLERVPDASFEVTKVAAPGSNSVLPFLWGSAPDPERLDEALRDDPSTTAVTRIVRDGDCTLYGIEWRSDVRVFVTVMVEEQGTLVDAHAGGGTWRFQMLFADTDAMSSFYDACKTHDVGLEIRSVNDLGTVARNGGTRLSDAQYEALSEALDADYYSVPRGVTLVDLSKRIGVSHQAVSERLRRGHAALVESTLDEGMAATASIS